MDALPTCGVASQIFESSVSTDNDHRDDDPGYRQKEGDSVKVRWQLGPCIGKGAFAEVFQVRA